MIVKDLSNSFNPYPKNGLKIESCKMMDGKKVVKKKRRYKKENKWETIKNRFLYYATKHKI